MKVHEVKCPNCCSNLTVQSGLQYVTCEYCGTTLALHGANSQLNSSEEAGYQFEKGRQRAQLEAQQAQYQQAQYQQAQIQYQQSMQAQSQKPKRKTWLWVLGWIFCWPAALTALFLKGRAFQDVNMKVRIFLVVMVWIMAIGIYATTGTSTNSNDAAPQSNVVATEAADAES